MTSLSAILSRISTIEAKLGTLVAPAPVASPQPTFAAVIRRELAPTPAAPTGVDAAVREAASRYGLDPALVHAVIKAESDYDPKCHSHAGAMGLMQLMPETCRDYGISDPYDATQNIMGGCRELREHLDQFGGDTELALAAYNAGPNAVRRHGGIPPYRETQAYVPRVMGYWKQGVH
jgi:soluble lytic murein transglycosylase-like protein